MAVDVRSGKIVCADCGQILGGGNINDDHESEIGTGGMEPAPQAIREKYGPIFKTHVGEVTRGAEDAFEWMRAALLQGDEAEAMRQAKRSVELQSDFADGHLWMARLSDSDDEKRYHIEELLAYNPRHLEGIRMLMVLNGEMTQAEADRSRDLYHDGTQEAEDPVEAKVKDLLCPVCRGTLTVHDDGSVVCEFCGYDDESDAHAKRGNASTSLTVALIKQRGQAVRWKIGERIIHCNQCGAERTIPARKMSGRCPFCGSKQVVVQDALDVFRQPDGLLKFKINKQRATEIVEQRLDHAMEKVVGFFMKNKVERMRVEGTFLPFWIFDVFLNVNVSDFYRDNYTGGYAETTKYVDQVFGARVCGVTSPPKSLTDKLGDYDLDEIIPYTPKLLARYPAELYSIDFDRASLDVRGVVAQKMRRKYAPGAETLNGAERSVTPAVEHMEMKLLLLPVYVATMVEEDDEVRTALVNGQTGQIVMGRARKPGAS